MSTSPFQYPENRHVRQLNPGPYDDYRRYKSHLRVEFAGRCVYCRLPDTHHGQETFSVDHYRPKSKFERLSTVYTNLFYACTACNRRKGAYWPLPEHASTRFVPNPCDHHMVAHLTYRGAQVIAHSEAGNFTANELLGLNDPEAVEYREYVVSTIKTLAKHFQELKRTMAAIDRKLGLAREDERGRLLAGRRRTAENIEQSKKNLQRLLGDFEASGASSTPIQGS